MISNTLMSKFQKLIERILEGRSVSYEEAERILLGLGFKMESRGSHHVFRKSGYERNISIKRRPQLLPYQLNDLKEVLTDHGY
jgi:predicted RNA binding protein YcfA (HicA-like mRNA interferase family)